MHINFSTDEFYIFSLFFSIRIIYRVARSFFFPFSFIILNLDSSFVMTTNLTLAQYNDLFIGCKAYVEGYDTSYGYIPTKAAGIAFCVLFGLSMFVHVAQFCWKRTWWCSLFSIGCLGSYRSLIPSHSATTNTATVELLGWAGRTWSSECPYNSTAFMIQISTLIIGTSTTPSYVLTRSLT